MVYTCLRILEGLGSRCEIFRKRKFVEKEESRRSVEFTGNEFIVVRGRECLKSVNAGAIWKPGTLPEEILEWITFIREWRTFFGLTIGGTTTRNGSQFPGRVSSCTVDG